MIELYEIGCSNKNNEELLNLLRKINLVLKQ